MTQHPAKALSLTVGIPTCYGGQSLIDTARSLRASTGVGQFRFLIVADRTPISEQHRQQLKELGVELTWNKVEGSQHKKLCQLIEMVKTDLFVFTQDDITFLPDTLSKIVQLFVDHPDVTMTSTRILPLPPETQVEAAMAAGVSIVDRICLLSKTNNHLMASGRCLAFRTKAIKQFVIAEQVVNGDMYLYLENLRNGGVFKHARNAKVFIRCPHSLKDQVGPSSRYQFQRPELKQYFEFDFDEEYGIPVGIKLQAIKEEFLANPFNTVAYFALFTYTRIFKQKRKKVINPIWEVDTSTKSGSSSV